MLNVRKSLERGRTSRGWLDSWHTFSFSDYYDPHHLEFRSLRVINEDRVAPGAGFEMHSHRNMEIITYVISGELRHEDSLGNSGVIRAGEIQRMGAGTGVMHSELNHSKTDPVHFLQIWIKPDLNGLDPEYDARSFEESVPGEFHLVASGSGREDSIAIHQSCDLYIARLPAGFEVSRELSSHRHAWVQMISGEVEAGGQLLTAGDGLAISGESQVMFRAVSEGHLLFFTLS